MAALVQDGACLSILVKDAGARHPITIDPLIAVQEAKLTATDAASDDWFGNSVALPGDTALVAAMNNSNHGGADTGAAYLVIGTFAQSVPFEGGFLVPEARVVAPVTTSASGEALTLSTMPLVVQSGVSLFQEYWIQDNRGPVGFAASNVLKLTTP